MTTILAPPQEEQFLQFSGGMMSTEFKRRDVTKLAATLSVVGIRLCGIFEGNLRFEAWSSGQRPHDPKLRLEINDARRATRAEVIRIGQEILRPLHLKVLAAFNRTAQVVIREKQRAGQKEPTPYICLFDEDDRRPGKPLNPTGLLTVQQYASGGDSTWSLEGNPLWAHAITSPATDQAMGTRVFAALTDPDHRLSLIVQGHPTVLDGGKASIALDRELVVHPWQEAETVPA